MTTMLETEQTLGARTPQEFFLNSENYTQVDPFIFSQDFWIRNSDLVSADSAGVVSQYHDTDEHDSTCVTLTFDARGRDYDGYIWQVTRADRNSGRVMKQLDANKGVPAAYEVNYDAQGSIRGVREIDPTELALEIQSLTENKEVVGSVDELRARKEKMQRELGLFSVEGRSSLGQQKFIDELHRRQRQVAEFGFSAMSTTVLSVDNVS